MKDLMRIRCDVHGWFHQVPYDHVRLNGCPSCSNARAGQKRRLPKTTMVERARCTHGDRYSYGNMPEGFGAAAKMTITCKIHGDFKQRYEDHVGGDGCPRCSGRHRWSTDEFVKNSVDVHGKIFTYDRTKYIGALEDIVITCKTHGDFTTQPSRHVLRGDGCPQCSPTRHTTIDDFLTRAKAKFGERYDYSSVEYVNVTTPVKIICAFHGVFEQPPVYHLQNAIGCQECSYNVSSKETAWLDSLKLPATTKRQAKITLGGRRRNVDAYDEQANTVYEFWGSWWHGHPDFFPPDDVHPKTKKTYGQLYQETLEKRRLIVEAGYTLVEIWEHDYNTQVDQGVANKPHGRLSRKMSLADQAARSRRGGTRAPGRRAQQKKQKRNNTSSF